MHFIVTDRRTIEQGIVVRSAYVVISIRDPGRRKARLRRQASALHSSPSFRPTFCG